MKVPIMLEKPEGNSCKGCLLIHNFICRLLKNPIDIVKGETVRDKDCPFDKLPSNEGRIEEVAKIICEWAGKKFTNKTWHEFYMNLARQINSLYALDEAGVREILKTILLHNDQECEACCDNDGEICHMDGKIVEGRDTCPQKQLFLDNAVKSICEVKNA